MFHCRLPLHTWHCLDIVGGMHGHHFSINPNPIFIVWVQMRWQLYERKRWLRVWVEVFLQRVRAKVYIAFVDIGHFYNGYQVPQPWKYSDPVEICRCTGKTESPRASSYKSIRASWRDSRKSKIISDSTAKPLIYTRTVFSQAASARHLGTIARMNKEIANSERMASNGRPAASRRPCFLFFQAPQVRQRWQVENGMIRTGPCVILVFAMS